MRRHSTVKRGGTSALTLGARPLCLRPSAIHHPRARAPKVLPFPIQEPGSWQDRFNLVMSGVRIAVEWGFGKIMSNFQYLNHEENLKVLRQPVGIYYPVANILANCHTCLYCSITGDCEAMHPQTKALLAAVVAASNITAPVSRF